LLRKLKYLRIKKK